MTVRLKETADLLTSCISRSPRPFVALENLASGTGRLLDGIDLPERAAPDSGAASVEIGDVLFGKLRPYLAKTWLADRPVFASTELLCLRPRAGIDSHWLAYLVASSPVMEWAVATSDGTKMPRTSWEKLGEYRTLVPPIDDQRAIADYLDRETARIDALIEKKRRMVELLEARFRASQICMLTGKHHTDRIQNPIFGSIPSHWTAKRAKYCTSGITVGVVINPSSYFVDEGVPFIHGTDVREGWIDEVDLKAMSLESNLQLRKSVVSSGDVVAMRVGYPGRAAVVPPRLDGSNCASVLIFRQSSQLKSDILAEFLNSQLGRFQIDVVQYGAAQAVMNVSDAVNLIIPVPPLEEQQELANQLALERNRWLSATDAITKQVSLLGERRQALITAAVTGQLDILGAAV